MAIRSTSQVYETVAGLHVTPHSTDSVDVWDGDGKAVNLRSTDFDMCLAFEKLIEGASLEDLHATFSEVPRERLAGFLEALQRHGWIRRLPKNSGNAPSNGGFDSRLLAYLSSFEDEHQNRFDLLQRIRSAHVLLLGVGSLGSWTLQHLAANGVGNVTLVDDDTIDETNLARQSLFSPDDVGKLKVERAATLLGRQFPRTKIAIHRKRIRTSEDLIPLIEPDMKLIVQTIDEPVWQISRVVGQAAISRDTPWLKGNSSGVGPLLDPAHPGSCPVCPWNKLKQTQPNLEQTVALYGRYQLGKKSAISTDIAQMGSLLAHEAIMFLLGQGLHRSQGLRLHWNSLQSPPTTVLRDPQCEVCGRYA